MKRFIGLALALPFALGAAGPASAYQVVYEAGLVGDVRFEDSLEMPGKWCGYSREYPPNYAYFRWMKVRRPLVEAADRNAGQRDSRKVRWFWKLQRGTASGTTWTTVASSAKQTKIAYEDQAAALTPLRIDYNTGTQPHETMVFRALVTIQFLRPNGTVEGTVRATLDWERRNEPWGYATGQNGWCAQRTTSG